MRSKRRLFFYILLNVVISASVTFSVLWWWERSHSVDLPVSRPEVNLTDSLSISVESVVPVIQSGSTDLPPLNVQVIEISNVIGVGDLGTERILLSRLGEGDLWLTGWELHEEGGSVYEFPNLQLNKDGAVQVYTRSGTNSVIALYWGMLEPVFEVGETVTLVDSEGNVRTVYRIP
jgi:hypothetical protein